MLQQRSWLSLPRSKKSCVHPQARFDAPLRNSVPAPRSTAPFRRLRPSTTPGGGNHRRGGHDSTPIHRLRRGPSLSPLLHDSTSRVDPAFGYALLRRHPSQTPKRHPNTICEEDASWMFPDRDRCGTPSMVCHMGTRRRHRQLRANIWRAQEHMACETIKGNHMRRRCSSSEAVPEVL